MRGGALGLLCVGPVVWEFVCVELGMDQVKFEDVGKGRHKVYLLLQAGYGTDDGEKVVCVCYRLGRGVWVMTPLDGEGAE